MNTAVPILTEIVEDVVEVSDISNSSGKHAFCVKLIPLSEVFAIILDLPSEQWSNSPYMPYSRPPRTSRPIKYYPGSPLSRFLNI